MLLHRFEFWRQQISPQWSQQVCSWNISDRYSGPVPFSDLCRSSSAWKSILWRAVSKRKDLRIRVEWSVCSVYVRTAAAAWGRLVFSGRPIKRLLQLLNLPEIKAWMSFFIAVIAQIQKPWTATSQTHFLNFPAFYLFFLRSQVIMFVSLSRGNICCFPEIMKSFCGDLKIPNLATQSRRVTVQSTTTSLLADGKETTNICACLNLMPKKRFLIHVPSSLSDSFRRSPSYRRANETHLIPPRFLWIWTLNATNSTLHTQQQTRQWNGEFTGFKSLRTAVFWTRTFSFHSLCSDMTVYFPHTVRGDDNVLF